MGIRWKYSATILILTWQQSKHKQHLLEKENQYKLKKEKKNHLKPPNSCCPYVDLLPPALVAVENPDQSSPEPVLELIALPINAAVGRVFSFSTDASSSPPTMPMSAKFTFLAVDIEKPDQELKTAAMTLPK